MSTTLKPNPRRTAKRFHALADPTRVRVIEMLSNGERCVCELQDALGAAQSRLSFHLRVLRDAGLVTDRREGRWNYYSLRADVLEEMAAYLESVKPDPDAVSLCACGRGPAGDCC